METAYIDRGGTSENITLRAAAIRCIPSTTLKGLHRMAAAREVILSQVPPNDAVVSSL